MKFSAVLKIFIFLIAFTFIAGCSKSSSEYKSGIYWLEKENNWQMAAKNFRRALETDPESWKIHSKLIEALSMGEEPDAFEQQLRRTLSIFPDSARGASFVLPGVKLLGESRYNKLAGSFELNYLGAKLAKDRGNTEILARCIMAACRVGDTLAVVDYYKMALTATQGKALPDSVSQEMRFFLGPSQLDWLNLDWQIAHNPDNLNARLSQLNAGLILGDSALTRKKLKELTKAAPSAVEHKDIALRFGRLTGFDPFGERELARGWDGSLSADKSKIIFIRNMGDNDYPDLYLYEKQLKGGKDRPILKAGQQRLGALAWPHYSPDDKWIYFYGSPDKDWVPGKIGRFNLYRVKPAYNSVPEKLTDSDLIITEPYYEKNGTVLLVRKDIGSSRASVEIIRVTPDKKAFETVSRIGEPVSSATFTSNGDSLLFATDRGIFRRSINGGIISVDLPWIGIGFLQLSPDGRLLKFINRGGQMIFIDRNNPQPMYLGSIPSPWISWGENGSILVTGWRDGWRRVVQLNINPKIIDNKEFLSFTKQ